MTDNEALLAEYLERLKAAGRSVDSCKAPVMKYFDFLSGADPMAGDLEAFRSYLVELGMKKSTVKTGVSRVRKFLEWLQAGRTEALPEMDPADGVSASPVPIVEMAPVEPVVAAPMVEPFPVVPVKVPEAVQLPMFPDTLGDGERKTAKLNIYVGPTFARLVELLSDYDGLSVTDFVYRVLRHYVESRREDVNFLLGQEAERQKRRAAKGL